MNRAAIDNLRRVLNDAGTRILDDPLRVEGWLSDYGRGGLKLENFALVTALRENIPQALLTAAKNGSMDVTTGLLVEKLRKTRGLAPEVCAWAVAGWIEALGLASGANKPHIPAASLPGAGKRLGRRRSSGVYWPGVLVMAVIVDLIIVLTSPFLGFTARSMDIVLETDGPVLGFPLLFGFTVCVIYILARLEGKL